MAAPSYVAQGAAQAVTTSAAMPYPTGLVAGDLLILHVSSSVTGIGNAPAGWTELGTLTTAGSMSSRRWTRISDGTETGSVTINVTSGTKGVGYITAYRPANAGGILTPSMTSGADTTSNNTSYSATGSSWTIGVDDRVVCETVILTTGAFTGNATSPTIAQTSATLSNAARFAGRTGTNTIYYGHHDASVTTGSTNTPTFTATTVGANGTGHTVFVRIRETLPVTGSRATSWNTKATVTGSRATTWHAKASVSGSRATTWNTKATVAGSRSTTWNVAGGLATVTGSRSTTWRTLAGVTGSRSTSWDTLATVSGSRSTSWDTLANVTGSRVASWRTLSTVTGSRSASWDTRSTVTGARATTWRALATVTGSRSTLWAVLATGTVTGSRSTSWHVKQTVAGTRAASWRVLRTVTGARQATWDTRATITAERATSWRVLEVVGGSRSTTWDVLQTVSDSRSTSWAVESSVPPRDLVGTFRVAGGRAVVTLSSSRATVTLARDRARFILEED